MTRTSEIAARLAAATPFDFCFWPEEGQAWAFRINGHTYFEPESYRLGEWLTMVNCAPSDLAYLLRRVAELEAWQQYAKAFIGRWKLYSLNNGEVSLAKRLMAEVELLAQAWQEAE